MKAFDIKGIVVRIVAPKLNARSVYTSEVLLSVHNTLLGKPSLLRIRFIGDSAKMVEQAGEGEIAHITYTIHGYDFKKDNGEETNYTYLHGVNLSV